MAMSWWNRLWKRDSRRVVRPIRGKPRQNRFVPNFETLAERIALAVTASFSPATRILSAFGDALNNTIAVTRDAAGIAAGHRGENPSQVRRSLREADRPTLPITGRIGSFRLRHAPDLPKCRLLSLIPKSHTPAPLFAQLVHRLAPPHFR